MPYTTELTDDCLGILHYADGLVTGAELLAASVAARQLVENTENFNFEVADFSEATELQITPGELLEIVAEDRAAAEFRAHAIIVIIAPGAAFYRMATEWADEVRDLGWTIHLSRDRTEGLQWLGKHREEARQSLLAAKEKPATCE